MMQKSKRVHDYLFIFLEKYLSSLPLKHAYIKFFEKATLEEFEIVDINENDTILHIGCGPLPNTLITLAQHFKANYTGIDKDKEAVKIARKIVKEYRLNIKIEEGDAIDYPLQHFDIIIVSYGVEPKEKIFKRLRKETKENVRIILRKQWDFMDTIYGRNIIPEGFKVIGYKKRRDFLKSYLLMKV